MTANTQPLAVAALARVEFRRPSGTAFAAMGSNRREYANLFNPFWEARLAPLNERHLTMNGAIRYRHPCARVSHCVRARTVSQRRSTGGARCPRPGPQRSNHLRSYATSVGTPWPKSSWQCLRWTPFILGIPLLGKQLDVKHKTYDAARYAVWERTVWRNDSLSNRKGDDDISLEVRDRTLGDPVAGLLAAAQLRSEGLTENPFWRDAHKQRLMDYRDDNAPVSVTQAAQRTPVEVGYQLVPGPCIRWGGR